MNNIIEIENLNYRFPESSQRALVDINWSVKRGSFVLLTGDSGSGKTTLLRCLNGLIPHFHGGTFGGSVNILGRSTYAAGPRDLAAQVGFVFQDPESQFVTSIVEDELVFTMEQLGFQPKEMQQRVDRALTATGSQHLTQRRIAELSGGERQRVALAAAICAGPAILLLDEPLSQLDSESTDQIIQTIQHLNREHGLTIIMAEHRLTSILPIVDQIFCMADGRLGPQQTTTSISFPKPDLPPDGNDIDIGHAGQQPTGTQILAMQDVTFGYGDQQVLQGVSFEAGPNEILGLIGPNGSGKTTLLKHLNGLLQPDRGVVRFNRQDIRGQPVHQVARSIAYVPQHSTSILHQETVRDELQFTLSAHGLSTDPLDILQALGIEQHIDRHPLDLSGGERQRLAIAALAVAGAPILALDEPTRGLPRTEKVRLSQFVRRFARNGKLVLIATHELEFLQSCASRILELQDGRLVEAQHLAISTQRRTEASPLLTRSYPD